MRIRKIIIIGGLVILGAPLLAGVIATLCFYAIFYFPNDSGSSIRTIRAAGEQREYLLYVPKSYDPARPAPLVLSLHPAMSWPTSEMGISQWNRVADEQGFLVAYPAGSGIGPKVWLMEGRQTPATMPDVRFISTLLDTLEASYNIDHRRIYADGLSNGGGMAFVLACTLPDRIAAVGMVAAARSLGWDWCPAHRPVPAIAFHGTADHVAPYDGGPNPVGPGTFPSVLGFTATWAERNRCDPTPEKTAEAENVTRLTYVHCSDSATVALYTIQGGGHQWPGGKPLPAFLVGPYTASINATRLMWTFFQEHPLPSMDQGQAP